MSNVAEVFELDGVEWTRCNYGPGDDMFQRACPAGCDKGLLLAPARFCGKCGGDGFEVTTIDPRGTHALVHAFEEPQRVRSSSTESEK